MVLKQKGKPEKGKKPVRGGPRQFSDPREFPDGPSEDFECREREGVEDCTSEDEKSCTDSSSEEEAGNVSQSISKLSLNEKNKPAAPKDGKSTAIPPKKELSRRDREAMEKDQARQHYLKMKEKEDAARLAIVRKQREEAAAQHAEEQKAKEMARRRI